MSVRWEHQELDASVEGVFHPQVDAAALTARLGELGAEGREVVSGIEMTHGRTRDVVVLLKRPRS